LQLALMLRRSAGIACCSPPNSFEIRWPSYCRLNLKYAASVRPVDATLLSERLYSFVNVHEAAALSFSFPLTDGVLLIAISVTSIHVWRMCLCGLLGSNLLLADTCGGTDAFSAISVLSLQPAQRVDCHIVVRIMRSLWQSPTSTSSHDGEDVLCTQELNLLGNKQSPTSTSSHDGEDVLCTQELNLLGNKYKISLK